MTELELILGGARSGKSRLAEQRAVDCGRRKIYIATAEAGDGEMAERIGHHQQRRDDSWQVRETPLNLAATLEDVCAPDTVAVVDCLTLWLCNCLHRGCWPQQRENLLACLPQLPGQVILVSNETGLGVVPMGQLSREFVDQSGFLHQQLATLCSRVTLCVAGLPLTLKP